MAYRGKYKIKNIKKYKGDPNSVVYRSLWERQVMVRLDTSAKVIEWASESIIIPYYSPVDKKVHRYFPDFWIKMLNRNNEVVQYIVEVKPKAQTQPPVPPKRKTKRFLGECLTYQVNIAKWQAAQNFCKKHNMTFQIWTEDHIQPAKRIKRTK